MKTYIPIGAAVIAMIAVAIIQGNLSERWNTFPELQLFAEQVPNMPKQVGEWTFKSEEKTDRKIMEVAGAETALSRTFQNAKGESVGVFVICGRPQELRHHTPDRCYPAAGFEQTSSPAPEDIETADGKQAGFMTATYTKVEKNGAQTAQRVYWSFTNDGNWKAPSDFRFSFGGTRAMYKVYITAPVNFREKTGDVSAAKELIRDLMPALNKSFEPALSHVAAADGKAPAVDEKVDEKTAAPNEETPAASEKAAAPEAKGAAADAKPAAK